MPLKYLPPEMTVYKVTYADADMDGLVVRIRAIPLSDAVELEGMTFTDGSFDVDKDELILRYKQVVDQIIDWNLPFDPTVENLMAQEPSWVIKFMAGWLKAMSYVSELPTVNVEPEDHMDLLASLPMEAFGE